MKKSTNKQYFVIRKLIEKSKELEERLRQILDLQVKLEESRQSCSAMATKLGVFSMTIETLEARVKSLEDDNKVIKYLLFHSIPHFMFY